MRIRIKVKSKGPGSATAVPGFHDAHLAELVLSIVSYLWSIVEDPNPDPV
jgi:hypothetical protein